MSAPVRSLRRWSVRVRLTAVYGALFLASGAAVLATTYVLVDHAPGNETVTLVMPDGTKVAANADVNVNVNGPSAADEGGAEAEATGGDMPDPAQVRALAAAQHAARMRTLLTRSGIALGVMALVSVALGWIVAGRTLRPLRTITSRTRRITANDLHERLSLNGPADELKELGDTIDDLLARLELSFQAQREFVANASHELRSPLARQRTIAQVALDDPDATVTSLRAAHERVLAAGAQQERLIDALLTLARGQAGVERAEHLDLSPIAEEVLAARRIEADARGVVLCAQPHTAAVLGDRRLIERLVANLVDNAVLYNHPSGRVLLTTGMRRGRPTLTVTNTGPVVPRESADRLFEPFVRLDAERTHRTEGHGLGLSIVKAIADVHQATVTVDPEPRGGLRVTATFPAPADAARAVDRQLVKRGRSR